MSYNTGNPVPSKDPRDLVDNAENLDRAVNGDDATWTDRLGRERKSWRGMENDFSDFLANSGYQLIGDYAPGIEITAYNQIVRDGDGEFWRLSGQTELPYVTTGAGLPEGGAFVAVGDAALRQELASPTGAAMVGVLGPDGEARTLGDLSTPIGAAMVGLEQGGTVSDAIKYVTPEMFGAIGDGVTDDTQAVRSALATGLNVKGEPASIYAISSSSAITTDGQEFDGRGCSFLWIGASADKDDAPIRIEGQLTNVKTVVSGDYEPYATEFVCDTTGFSVGDYIVFNYSVPQVEGGVPLIPCNPFGLPEFIAQITEIGPSSLSIDYPRGFELYGNPPAGGVLEIIKVIPVVGATVKNYSYRQSAVGDTNVWNSAASLTYTANCSAHLINSSEIVGYGVRVNYSHNTLLTGIKSERPSAVGGGQGYCVQVRGSMGTVIYRAEGLLCRHTVDISECSGYTKVVECRARRSLDGAFGSHGGFEHDIEYIGNQVFDSGTGVYIATSGPAFGDKTKNVAIKNHTNYNVTTGVYAAIGTTAKAEGVTIDGYRSIKNSDFTGYDIRLGSDNVKILNSDIQGTVHFEGSNGALSSDVLIKNSKIRPQDGIAISASLPSAKVIVVDGDTKGMLYPRSGAKGIVFDGGSFSFSNNALIAGSFGFYELVFNGCEINVDGNVVDQTIASRKVRFTNTRVNMGGGSAHLYFDSGVTDGEASLYLAGNKGDITFTARRFREITLDGNEQVNGADEYLSLVNCSGAIVRLTDNNFIKVNQNAFCVDFSKYSSPGQSGLSFIVMGNRHNGVLNLLSSYGSIDEMTCVGNVYSPDSGDTNLQSAFRPSEIPGQILYSANIGY